jgi:uncharacterized SAM-binding protein YcdF (DUF218 family)
MTNREKFIAFVDNDLILKSDVVVLLEGDGLHRCQKAVELVKNGWADKLLFSGGITDYSYGSYPFKDLKPELLKLGLKNDQIILESESQNTYEQAVNVITLATENEWKKLILVATHDHQYRAYLTFLKQILLNKLDIILINSPVRNLPWFNETGWGSREDRMINEFKKIDQYMSQNHLSSFEEAIAYQKTKEAHILKSIGYENY